MGWQLDSVLMLSKHFSSLDAKLQEQLSIRLQNCIFPHFDQLAKSLKEKKGYHSLQNFADRGGFQIAKLAFFIKQTFLTTSITTDGTFIYIYVSSNNGGMFKVGPPFHLPSVRAVSCSARLSLQGVCVDGGGETCASRSLVGRSALGVPLMFA